MENKFIVGQIIQKKKSELYLVAFATLYDNIATDPNSIKNYTLDTPAIIGRTSDLFFKFRRWTVIGNAEIKADSSFFPNYKIETLEGVFITTFDRQVIRKASKAEEDFYFFYSQVSPAWFVGAVKAFHGYQNLDHDYIKLTYDYVRQRSNAMN